MKKLLDFLKGKDLYLGICRYLLAFWMIPYGITKIFRTQFVVLPFALWQRPLESLSGKNLAWAFLGYSDWFQVLLGFLELIPCLFLLYRRTTLLGAILLLPMTLSVFLINQALDLWEATQQISTILLVLNIILLLFHWPVIKQAFLLITQKTASKGFPWIQTVISVLILSVVGFFSITDLLDYRSRTNSLTGDWLNAHPHEWTLQKETINDSILAPRLMKSYFGSYGEYSEINDTGVVRRGAITYDLNEKDGQIQFTKKADSAVTVFKYRLTDSILVLEKAGPVKFKQVFKRRVINQ